MLRVEVRVPSPEYARNKANGVPVGADEIIDPTNGDAKSVARPTASITNTLTANESNGMIW